MLDVQVATKIARSNFPNGQIAATVDYGELYLFQIFDDRPGEEGLDPFYSVNKQTGEFRDFSLFTDGNTVEIVELFMQAKSMKGET